MLSGWSLKLTIPSPFESQNLCRFRLRHHGIMISFAQGEVHDLPLRWSNRIDLGVGTIYRTRCSTVYLILFYFG
jgi:hypothetical protein